MAQYMRGYIHFLSLGQMSIHDTSGPEPCLRDRGQVRSRVHAFLLSVSFHHTVSSGAHRCAELDQGPVRAAHIGDDLPPRLGGRCRKLRRACCHSAPVRCRHICRDQRDLHTQRLRRTVRRNMPSRKMRLTECVCRKRQGGCPGFQFALRPRLVQEAVGKAEGVREECQRCGDIRHRDNGGAELHTNLLWVRYWVVIRKSNGVAAQPAQSLAPIGIAERKMRVILTPSSVTQLDEGAAMGLVG